MVSTSCLWIISGLFLIGNAAEPDINNTQSRQKRLFSIFNIVTFKNDPCTTTGTGNLGGTCMTSAECTAKSGSASGNCAAGFGVCCLFIVSGACGTTQTINQNCTYIRNNGSPSADTTVSQTCAYNFNRICDNLCQIRLDFRTLSTSSSATGSCGGDGDSVTVVSPFSSSANAFPPTVCGILTGQHMYFETGTTGDAGTLSIAKGTGAGSRSFDIKATYYTCDSVNKAPAGCTQYFTGETGTFQSYNHAGGQLLVNQNYNNCFRQELGFCRLRLEESATSTPDPFLLSAPDTAATVTCTALSHVIVMTPGSSMICGGKFALTGDVATMVETTSGSFQVGLITLGTLAAGITGFNLDYEQIACA